MKLIIFDLDGVIYDSKKFHFEALNKALKEVFQIMKYLIKIISIFMMDFLPLKNLRYLHLVKI